MGGNIISLADRRAGRLASGKAKCLACKHEWVAVVECPAVDLECPECGCNRGVYKGAFTASEGDAVFTCNCGNTLFEYIAKRDGRHFPMCIGCGEWAVME